MEIEHFPSIKEILQNPQLSRTAAMRLYGSVFDLFGKIAAAHAAAPLRQHPESTPSSNIHAISIYQ